MNSKTQTEIQNTSLPLMLLEIGTEEIPARFLPDTLKSLSENAAKLFVDARLSFGGITTYATPRRITLMCELNPLQAGGEKEFWGPPAAVAFDASGKPTKAAEAFAKTHGIPVEALSKKEKGKGVYAVAVVKEEASQTAALLPELLPRLILSLHFPKTMRWGTGNLRFVRPIRWILAMYDTKKVEFEIDGIRSSNTTRGHRFLSPASFELKEVKSYVNMLRNNYVIVNPEERGKIIQDESLKLAQSLSASVVEDPALLQHVTYLTEYPIPVAGTFPANYLALPRELLIIVMKDHQKYFAVENAEGKLLNHFIVVSNTKLDNADMVTKGAERVIKARFEDARFYFEEDKKATLKERFENLNGVIYHERLGTLFDKSHRMASIAEFIAEHCCPSVKEEARTAALLAKADLLSGVVKEFPELQGIMGYYYALHEGYSKEVATAFAEQYLPAFSGDRLPQSDIGAVVSLADKLDNIASFFVVGLAPTSTEDPFALRRQALGIIQILISKKSKLPLPMLIEKALQPYAVKQKDAQLVNEILRFFEQRIEPLFSSQGYPFDSIASVSEFIKSEPLYTFKERLDAVQKLKTDPEYEPFLLAIKRVNNLAPKEKQPTVNAKLFVQEEESALSTQVKAVTPRLQELLKEDRYYEAMQQLLTLKDAINRFFDKVLVMDKDEKIKQNRLSLLKSIQLLARSIADFSKLG